MVIRLYAARGMCGACLRAAAQHYGAARLGCMDGEHSDARRKPRGAHIGIAYRMPMRILPFIACNAIVLGNGPHEQRKNPPSRCA